MKASSPIALLAMAMAWSVSTGCSYHTVELPVDLGAGSQMEVTPSQVAADGVTPVQVKVTLVHSNGSPASDLRVHLFSSDPNDILVQNFTALRANEQLVPGEDGVVQARFVSSYPGSKLIICSVLDGNRPLVNLSGSVIFLQPTSYPTFGAQTDQSLLAAGDPFTLVITALSGPGAVATDYVGTISLTSSDPNAVLPATVSFTPGDQGTVRIENVVLHQAGSVTITVTDTTLSSLNGQLTLQLEPADMAGFAIALPDGAVAGRPASVSVSAVDAFGNLTPGYTGMVTITAADPENTNGAPALPAGVVAVFDANTRGQATLDDVLTLYKVANAVVLSVDDGLGHTGSLGNIAVWPADANALNVVADATTVPQGGTVHVTATVVDAYGNTATNSNLALKLTSSDPQAALPGPYTLTATDAGAHAFEVTLETVSTGADITVAPVHGTVPAPARATVAVTATGPYFTATWNSPGGAPAGTPLSLTLHALTQSGAPLTTYTGTVSLSTTDPNASLPATVTLTGADQGVASVQNIVLARAGTQYVIMKDAVNAMSGASEGIAVMPGPASSYAATVAGPITAGSPVTIHVEAQDAYGNTDPDYSGTMAIVYSDPQGTGPTSYTFVAADAGATDVMPTFRTAGQQMVVFTDATQQFGETITVVVSAAPPGTFAVQTDASTVMAGAAFGGMVRVYDRFGNPTSGYTGALQWGSNNANAALPQDDTFSPGDVGNHHFTATLYATTPNSVLVVSDSHDPNITGTSGVINVTAGPATQLAAAVAAGATPTAGVPFAVTLAATDAFGNVDPNNHDTLSLSCDAGNANLPAQVTLSQGTATVMVTLNTTPGAGLTVSDTNQPTLHPATLAMPLQAGAPSALTIFDTASPLVAGGNATFGLQATDSYGNLVTNYGDSFSVASSDPLFTPMVLTLAPTTGGTLRVGRAAGLELRTAGRQTVTLIGTNGGLQAQTVITVTPAAATKLGSSTAANPVAGTPVSVTLTALDPFSNVDPTFTGAIRFSSSDPCATFVGDANFQAASMGQLVLPGWATFGTVGPQTLLVTDRSQTQITGSTSNITVLPGPARSLAWTNLPARATAGVSFSATLEALDAYGNLATGYLGTVRFNTTSTPAGTSTVPSNRNFTNGDGGQHTFSGFQLNRAPNMTLIANDVANANITGQATLGVLPSSTPGNIVFTTQPQNTSVCARFAPSPTVQMQDIYNNVMTLNSNVIALSAPLTGLGGITAVAANQGVATFTSLYPQSQAAGRLHAVAQDTPSLTADSNFFSAGPQGPPTITLGPPAVSNGCVAFSAQVGGTCGALVDASVTYDMGSGPHGITIAPASAGQGNVRSDTALSYRWDAGADLPLQAANATLTFSAAAGGWTARQSVTAAVNNLPTYWLGGTFRTTGSSAVQLITAADLDSDRALDLIFTDGTGPWLVFNSAGSNGAVAVPWVAGATPLSLAAGDINQDGKVDLVGCVQGATARSMVYKLGRGDGTFGAVTPVAAFADCYDTLLTDIDNDGKRDILTQTMQTPGVVWALGDGAGHFTQAAGQSVSLSWAPAPGAMVADVTGDGNVDVLVSQAAPGTMAAFIRNIGTPARTTLNYAPGGSGFHFAHGDLNRDGADDVLMMNSAGTYVYTGVGDTTLGAPVFQPIPGNAAVLHDIDRDGFLDLVAGVNGAATVWHGDGVGGFAQQSTLTTAVNTGGKAIYVGALHGTPNLGIAISNGDNSVTVQATGTAQACAWDMKAVHLHPVAGGNVTLGGLAVGDFDEDGNNDVVTTTGPALHGALGDGRSSFDLPGLSTSDFLAGDGPGIAVMYGTPVSGDFNHDGHLDIAAPALNQNGVAILYNDGDADFTTPVIFNTAGAPTRLITVDLNNDGNLDFVTINGANNSMTTLYGPSYAAPVSRDILGRKPVGLASADLNNDGLTDIAVISQDTNALTVFINSGGGLVFNRAYTSSASPVGLALVDVNGDSNVDVVMADANARTLYVRLGTGSGALAGSVNYSLPCTPTALAMANFDGANGPDAAVSCSGNWEGMLVIYNNGAGNLSYTADHAVYVPLGAAPGPSVAADFSNDGWPDVATASTTTGVLTLAVNQRLSGASAGFFGGSTNKLNGVPDDVALEDINRDGLLDVLATNNSQLGVLLGTGGTVLAGEADFGVSASPAGLATGQILHDGVPDVVVGSDATGSISWYRNATPRDGTAASISFSSSNMSFLPYAPTRVTLADVDNNGTLDALVASDHLQVLQASAANMAFGAPAVTDLGGQAQGLDVADINRDGWKDAVLSIPGGNVLVVLLNDGTGAFPAMSVTTQVAGSPAALALGDISGDGFIDVVTQLTGNPAGAVGILTGDGTGAFQPVGTANLTVTQPSWTTKNVYLRDLDRDGALDLVVPMTRGFGVATFQGVHQTPYFQLTPSHIFTAGNGALDVAVGEMTRDGRPDLVVVDQVGNQVTVLPGG